MLVISDRVKESSISEGSGSITLDAPFGSFQSFSQGIGSGNTTYYCIENGTRWEVGQGVYSSAGNTLSRDVIFDSSASGAKINLEGVSVIFCTLPADRAIIQNENGHAFVSGIDFTPISEADYPPHQEGRIFFDAENHTISMYGEKPDVSLQIGQEQHLRVRNTNSYTLKNGSGVYLTGSQGTHPTVDYAIASGENTSHVVGLATHDIEPNSFGYITTYGIVRNVNTGAFSDGDELYLSAENSGVLVNISPIAPNYKSTIGHVIRSHPTNGTILVAKEGVKLGGGDAKTLRNIGVSGIAFFEGVTPDGNAGVLASDADFYYDSGNDRLHIGAGGIRFNDGTTQTTAGGGGGGGNRTYTNITADYSMSASDDVVFANSTSGPLNVYIPTAGGVGGKEVTIKTTAGNEPVTVVASGSELIDGQSSMTLYSRYESITLMSNNTNWFIT